MEGKITSFTKLKAWQKAHALALLTYQATESFPKTEVFGLVNQMRRAVVSVESNIAEGFSRQTSTDKAHFYNIALGSCTETQSQLLLSRDLKMISVSSFDKIASVTIEVHKLINGLIRSLRKAA